MEVILFRWSEIHTSIFFQRAGIRSDKRIPAAIRDFCELLFSFAIYESRPSYNLKL